MYTTVTIDNFRCFEHLEVGPLARVNLITGANNVGKTALLEALLLRLRGAEPGLPLDLGLTRGLPVSGRDPDTHLGALFHDFDIGTPVRISTNSDDHEWVTTLLLSLTEARPGPEGMWSLAVTPVQDQGRSPYTDYLSKAEPQALQRLALFSAEAIYLPSGLQLTVTDLADRFGEAQLAGEVRRVVETARCLEPRLTGLTMIHRGQPIVHAELEGQPRPVPLPLLGDGMNRFLAISLAMLGVHGGALLVDEIENGIYHKAMPDVWRGLAHAAREFNVQLFATTHSYECIRAAVEAFQGEFSDDLHLHRLDRLADGTIKATTSRAETLRAAVDMSMEVR